MLIDINTDQLQSAVQAARAANEAISEAAGLLNSVVVHTDWQCPERSEINDNTIRNRSQALTLQADAERLYSNINDTAEAFLLAEQQVSGSFNTVDGPIASFLSQTPASGVSEHAWGAAGKVLESAGVSGIKKATDVVTFGTIADMLKGK
jgi:hypothetical protein